MYSYLVPPSYEPEFSPEQDRLLRELFVKQNARIDDACRLRQFRGKCPHEKPCHDCPKFGKTIL